MLAKSGRNLLQKPAAFFSILDSLSTRMKHQHLIVLALIFCLTAFAPPGQRDGKYANHIWLGPHGFGSLIRLKSGKFYQIKGSSGFFTPTARTQTGIIIAKGDTFLLIPQRITFYSNVSQKASFFERRIFPRRRLVYPRKKCKCHSEGFRLAVAGNNQGYAIMCDTMKCYFKNDSLVFVDGTNYKYHKVED
jgi:hypothetical protein